MKEMTFRVSEIESFRQWRDDEEADLDLLLARMRGWGPASEAMAAGAAFHKALETAPLGLATELTAEGYTFRFVDDFTLALPPIREVRASKTYVGEDFAITVSGQLDVIQGKRVEDHKTTGRFDPERYLGGYQWRYYLDIFGADQFRWNVFEIANHDDNPKAWDVFAQHTLEQWRYPGMEDDCAKLAGELARFALTHLPERIHNLKVAA